MLPSLEGLTNDEQLLIVGIVVELWSEQSPLPRVT